MQGAKNNVPRHTRDLPPKYKTQDEETIHKRNHLVSMSALSNIRAEVMYIECKVVNAPDNFFLKATEILLRSTEKAEIHSVKERIKSRTQSLTYIHRSSRILISLNGKEEMMDVKLGILVFYFFTSAVVTSAGWRY